MTKSFRLAGHSVEVTNGHIFMTRILLSLFTDVTNLTLNCDLKLDVIKSFQLYLRIFGLEMQVTFLHLMKNYKVSVAGLYLLTSKC